jgi:hypothetical protein
MPVLFSGTCVRFNLRLRAKVKFQRRLANGKIRLFECSAHKYKAGGVLLPTGIQRVNF